MQDRAFRGLYLGSICSSATDGLIPVAFAVYSVQAFGAASALTIILISLWVGRFVCTPLAGRVAGHYNQFTVMILSDVARIAAQGGLALYLVVTNRDSLLAMSVSAAVYGAATAFYGPAGYTLMPQLVPQRELRTANALVAMVVDLSVLLGPAAAVVLLETVGFRWILVFDSMTFVVNLLALMYVRRIAVLTKPERTGADELDRDEPAEARDTVRSLVAAAPWLGWTVALWFVVSFAIGMVAVAGPALTVERTGGGGQWAVLATGMALAGLAGSTVLIAGSRQVGWPFMSAAVTGAVILELVAVAGYARGAAGPELLFVGCMTAGFMISVGGIVWQSLMQSQLSITALGRFSSTEGFVNAAGVPAGMAIGGVALSTIGIEPAAVLCIIVTAALAVAVRVSHGKRLDPAAPLQPELSGRENNEH
ncbi:MFS transporter [Nocardia jinanensis]|uniref:MFS transporter n=1 Tax=Nocardia jinanensis TaxID=382504 RepID=UPI0007A4BC83|nr:MFS transporter [Nocardia jinanensis]